MGAIGQSIIPHLVYSLGQCLLPGLLCLLSALLKRIALLNASVTYIPTRITETVRVRLLKSYMLAWMKPSYGKGNAD